MLGIFPPGVTLSWNRELGDSSFHLLLAVCDTVGGDVCVCGGSLCAVPWGLLSKI